MADHLSSENQLDGLSIVGEIPVACHPPKLESEIVVNSRICLSRNIAGFPFFDASSVEQRNEIRQIIVDHARFIQTHRPLEIIDCQQLKLLEHQFQIDLQSAIGLQIDEVELKAPEFSRQTDEESVETPHHEIRQSEIDSKDAVENHEETISTCTAEFQTYLFLNHEDHLQIQIEAPGDRLFEAYQIADQIDNTLQNHLSFAFHSKLGFLTACPSQVGTGMRASVMLHLPASVATGNLPVLMKQLSQSNVVAREVFGDPGGGEFFRLSSLATLGFRECDLLEQVRSAVAKAVELETESRQLMLAEDASALKLESRNSIRELESLDLSQTGLSDYTVMRAFSRIRLGLQLDLLTHAETTMLAGRIAILHLKEQLRLAIARENYRTASRLRDRINLLSGAIA